MNGTQIAWEVQVVKTQDSNSSGTGKEMFWNVLTGFQSRKWWGDFQVAVLRRDIDVERVRLETPQPLGVNDFFRRRVDWQAW